MIVHLLGVVLISGVLTTFGAATAAGSPLQLEASAQATTEQAPKKAKKAKKPKDPDKAAKTKKPKTKKPKSDQPAPDEPIDPDAEEAPPVEVPGPFVWKQHPSFRYKKAVRVDFEAKFQEDGHSSYQGSDKAAGLDPWEMHRNRIGIQGTLFKHIDFEVERELTEQELTEKDITAGITPKSQWKDVNVNVDYIKNAQIQVGKFKIPFGLDELTGVTHNDYVYRSAGANYLAPARDIGAMVHGRFFKRGLSYATGVFLHDGDNARSKKIAGGDQTFAARVTGKPFRRLSHTWFDALELGTALAFTHVTDDSFRPNGLRGRTIMTQDNFALPVYVKGQRSRWEGDLDWTVGPASLRAEYTRVVDERRNQSFTDGDLPDARYRSWYISGTWLITGETKTRPVKPDRELFGGGLGAVEVAVRYERIMFDSVNGAVDAFSNPRAENILPTGERALTLGVNWTVNRFIKLQFNGIREHVDDPDRNPVPNGEAFWSRVVRLQLVL